MSVRTQRVSFARGCIGFEVTQAATRLATDIYRLTRGVAYDAVHGWGAELRRAADALSTVIARVQARQHHTVFLNNVVIAGVLLAQLEGYLMIAEQRCDISVEDIDSLMPLIAFIKRFCAAGIGVDTVAMNPELVS